jgi:hypothetical protein
MKLSVKYVNYNKRLVGYKLCFMIKSTLICDLN